MLASAGCGNGASTPSPVASSPNETQHTTDPPASTGSPGSSKDDGGIDAATDGGSSATGPLTALQRHKAEMLTSVWENSTTILQYAYSENIMDGRGYTSGRAGFCTGTGDAVLVVACFDTAFGAGPANKMHKYRAALDALTAQFEATGASQASVTTLDALGDYNADWASSATAPATAAAFKGCQDEVVEKLYFGPAVAEAKKWGVSSALTLAALYDAEINMGDDGAGGVKDLVAKANAALGNAAQKTPTAPLAIADESAWLKQVLLARVANLGADATHAQSVDRVATYEALRRAQNFDLSQIIVTDAKAATIYPGQGYRDSGYPRCVIAANGSVTGDAGCTK